MRKLLLSVFILSSYSTFAKVQCLSKRDLIPDHCQRDRSAVLGCPSSYKPYNCKNIATKCSGYNLEATPYGFKSVQPSPKFINNVQFPRNDRYIYRGIPHNIEQITEEKFIAAVLGDDLLNVGTVYQWRTSQYLKDEIVESDVVRKNLVKGVKETSIRKMIKNMKLKKEFQVLKSCSSNFSERDAQRYASDLMMKSFKEIEKQRLTERYFLKFDYSAGSDYRSYGNWGEYLLFGSVYSNVASWLSGKMIMYNNSKGRSMDLNYYNHSIGEMWTYANADNGEVVTPGALTPDELEGLIISDSSPRSTDRLKPSVIDIAYLRFKENNEDYILVVDGSYNKCITKNKSGIPYFCSQRFNQLDVSPDNPMDISNDLIFGPAKLTKQAPVIAIISKRLPTAGEADLTSLFRKFKLSHKRLSPNIVAKIRGLRFFNGDKVMATQLSFPNLNNKIEEQDEIKVEPAKPEVVKETKNDPVVVIKKQEMNIKVISANFGRGHKRFQENNLLSYVERFCNGKKRCDFAVKPKEYFPKLVKRWRKAQLEVIYKCSNDGLSKVYALTGYRNDILQLKCE